ncbi:Norsolorinic acid reductase B [Talaromyces atroroseus]|uniref:Norsolorinic acid reductase B n=1 Tax=Talaromyces atroroseus TaxID=1441469 RepID=A0A225AYI7_TALAT|nr:Norsolorinic acid reductase B [Talaromyces atroroseus]OKL58557.1 Norsolorinic acid reductase B [Talaromyces atroroseus]
MSTSILNSPLARHRQLAPSAAVRVSPLCLGAMNFGDAHKERMGECTKETAFEILDYFFSQGGNFIDTATGYQAGQSEMWLGEWMATRKNCDQIVLATKYSGELMHSLNDLVSSGKALYLGISDTPAWVVARANQYARSNSLRQFSVYQGMWNAGMRDLERDIIPMCRAEGMGICPYGVLNQGRFQTEDGYKKREKNNPGRKSRPIHQHDKDVYRVLEKISKTKGENFGILHVALAYVMQKAPYVFPIVGGRTLEHIKGNITGLLLALTEKDIEDIESAYRFDPGFPHTFLSGTLLKGHDAIPKGAYSPSEVWYVDTMGTIDFVEPLKPIKPSRR